MPTQQALFAGLASGFLAPQVLLYAIFVRYGDVVYEDTACGPQGTCELRAVQRLCGLIGFGAESPARNARGALVMSAFRVVLCTFM